MHVRECCTNPTARDICTLVSMFLLIAFPQKNALLFTLTFLRLLVCLYFFALLLRLRFVLHVCVYFFPALRLLLRLLYVLGTMLKPMI